MGSSTSHPYEVVAGWAPGSEEEACSPVELAEHERADLFLVAVAPFGRGHPVHSLSSSTKRSAFRP